MFAVQDKVGDYEIVAKLKAGGMATLFLGKRSGASGFSRHVAIKVVHEHLANDATFVRMFVDEALLSSKIHHPNVVHVEELRQVGGRHFLVMEYVHGCSLSSLMSALRKRSRTLSPELAVYIAVKMAEGLHAAHTATDTDGMPLGVVHRDVSPQNILLAYRGHVKLIDFGVAKAAGRAQQTTGGSLKGKIRYMSPEQAFGKEVDSRTDVYALGVVLWEMLTGRKAFQAANELALLDLVRNPKLAPAREHNPTIPDALDRAISKALSKEPGDRFQSAQAMRKALAKAMPSALALDASDLEQLLAAVMVDAIQAEVKRLPESVSGVLAKAPEVEGEEIVLTLTVSAAGLSVPDEPSLPVIPEAMHEVAVTVATPPPTARATPAIAATPATQLMGPDADPPARSKLVPMLIAAAALVLLVGGAVGYFALTSSESEGITATELGESPTETAAEAPESEPAPDEPAAEVTGPEAAPDGPDEPDEPVVAPEPTADVQAADVDVADVDVPEGVDPPEAETPPATRRPPRRRGVRRRGRAGARTPPEQTTSGRDVGGVFLTDEF